MKPTPRPTGTESAEIDRKRGIAVQHLDDVRDPSGDIPLIAKAMDDLESAPLDDRLRAALRYVGKLTQTPSKITDADADAFYAAGWDERALHDAVAVCALFNMMNRLVEGWGIQADDDYFELSSERLQKGGYGGLAQKLGESPREP